MPAGSHALGAENVSQGLQREGKEPLKVRVMAEVWPESALVPAPLGPGVELFHTLFSQVLLFPKNVPVHDASIWYGKGIAPSLGFDLF